MQIEHVPLERIEVPTVRITNVMPAEIGEQFRLSIQTVGALQPIHVLKDGEKYVLVDGLHRLQELRAKGEATAPCVVTPGTVKDALIRNFSVSILQGRPKPSQARQVIRALEEDEGMDLVAIRKATGATEDYLSKLMWVNRAIPEVQDALDDEEISLGHAVALARVEDPDKQARLLAIQRQHRVKLDVFEQICRDVARQQVTVEQAIDRNVGATELPAEPHAPCGNCATLTPVMHLRPMMLCPVCFGEVYRATAAPPPATHPVADGARVSKS